MSKVTIYHNPRCSKSRATLAILEAHNMDIDVVKYLETPPNQAEIRTILNLLDVDIRSILRKNEADYKLHPFANTALETAELIELLHQFPKVMERPIVIYQDKAVIGRPPENVLELMQ